MIGTSIFVGGDQDVLKESMNWLRKRKGNRMETVGVMRQENDVVVGIAHRRLRCASPLNIAERPTAWFVAWLPAMHLALLELQK